MKNYDLLHRSFVMGWLGIAAAPGLSISGFAQVGPRIRTEWQQFKTISKCNSFLDEITAMLRSTNVKNPRSFRYWTHIPFDLPPHGSLYFLSWHRGYLYYFGRQLRILSGDLPLDFLFWDYFSNPIIPAEFADSSPGDPLYLARTGIDAYDALTLMPFELGVCKLRRSTTVDFEEQFETAEHNPVHHLIGGIMSAMQPPRGFAWLGYGYANATEPTALPHVGIALASWAGLTAARHLEATQTSPDKPAESWPRRTISAIRPALGGATRPSFSETSFSVLRMFGTKHPFGSEALIKRSRARKLHGDAWVSADGNRHRREQTISAAKAKVKLSYEAEPVTLPSLKNAQVFTLDACRRESPAGPGLPGHSGKYGCRLRLWCRR